MAVGAASTAAPAVRTATSPATPATTAAKPAGGGCMGGQTGAALTAGGATGAATAGRAPTAGLGNAVAGAATAASPAAGAPGQVKKGLTGTGAANPGVAAVKAEMSRSPIAADILNRMEQAGARLDVLSDADFQKRFPGAAGVFLPSANQMMMPASALRDTKKAALTLAHEGLHFLQDQVGNTTLAQTGGPLGQAIAATRAYGQARSEAEQANHDEAQSYVIESYVAKELGTRDFGFGTDKATGRTKSYAETLTAVKTSPFYN